MARWTQSSLDIAHLARVHQELSQALSPGFLIKVHLIDGREFEGMLGAMNFGSNAATSMPVSAYFGELSLRAIDRSVIVIDFLDVEHVYNFTTAERLAQYEKAGVIEIIDKPQG